MSKIENISAEFLRCSETLMAENTSLFNYAELTGDAAGVARTSVSQLCPTGFVLSMRAGGQSAPLYDVNVNETLGTASFCALRHVQKASRETPRHRAKPCVFFAFCPVFHPKKCLYMVCRVRTKRSRLLLTYRLCH